MADNSYEDALKTNEAILETLKSIEADRKAEAEKAEERRKAAENLKRIEDADKKRKDNSGNVERIVKGGFEGIKTFYKPWIEMDKLSTDIAKSIGMLGNARDSLRKQGIDQYRSEVFGMKFGISMEDMMTAQLSTLRKAERKFQISNKNLKDLSAMTSVFGDDITSDFISKLDRFGVGLSDAGKISGKMFAEASESGLSFETYSKNFLDNIKKAQTYTFSNGVEGVKNMAKKAAELQMSMESAFNLADKTRSVEGAIEVGARLQSLGGVFASNSNPLSLLHDANLDVESLQDKIINMFSGQAYMDTESGEIKMDAFSREKARAAADAMGIDFETLMDGIYGKARRSKIFEEIGRSGIDIDERTKELLMNIGTFDNGEAGYVDSKGEFKKLSDITEEDQKEMLAISKSESENIVDIAIELHSIKDILEKGITGQADSLLASAAEGYNPLNGLRTLTEKYSSTEINSFIGGFMGISAAKGVYDTITGGDMLSDILNGTGKKKGTPGGPGGAPMNPPGGTGPGGVPPVEMPGNGPGPGSSSSPGNGSKRPTIIGGSFKKWGKAGKLGKGIGIAGTAVDIGYNVLQYAQADPEDYTTKGKALGGTIGSSIGAAALGVLGPQAMTIGSLIGDAIGSAIGGAVGTSTGKKKAGLKQRYNLSDVKGNYSEKELKMISSLLEDGEITSVESSDLSMKNKKLYNKLLKNGVFGQFSGEFSYGGYTGPGRPGDVAGVVHKGEYVVPKHMMDNPYVSDTVSLLEKMRQAGTGTNGYLNGGVVADPSRMKSPLNVLSKNGASERGNATTGKIEVNFTGSITLEGGGKSKNITSELLDNKLFVKGMTDAIARQMNLDSNVRVMPKK